MTDRATHWDDVWADRDETSVSWFEPDPARSLALIRAVAEPPDARVVDVGGGASRLVDRLLDLGYVRPTVVDLSAHALARSRARLGARAAEVEWVVADVTELALDRGVEVWHDRAVLHFLTEPGDRDAYVAAVRRHVPVGGHVVLATFALDGPERCSGLPVQRYDAAGLQALLGDGFVLRDEAHAEHTTPDGRPQSFTYVRLERQR